MDDDEKRALLDRSLKLDEWERRLLKHQAAVEVYDRLFDEFSALYNELELLTRFGPPTGALTAGLGPSARNGGRSPLSMIA